MPLEEGSGELRQNRNSGQGASRSPFWGVCGRGYGGILEMGFTTAQHWAPDRIFCTMSPALG